MSSTPQSSRHAAASAGHTDSSTAERTALGRVAESARGSRAARTPRPSTPFPASPQAVSQADGEA